MDGGVLNTVSIETGHNMTPTVSLCRFHLELEHANEALAHFIRRPQRTDQHVNRKQRCRTTFFINCFKRGVTLFYNKNICIHLYMLS